MKRVYTLEDLDCANCAAKIEKAINDIPEVIKAEVSFMTQRLVVELEEKNLQEVEKKINEVVKKVNSDVTLKLR